MFELAIGAVVGIGIGFFLGLGARQYAVWSAQNERDKAFRELDHERTEIRRANNQYAFERILQATESGSLWDVAEVEADLRQVLTDNDISELMARLMQLNDMVSMTQDSPHRARDPGYVFDQDEWGELKKRSIRIADIIQPKGEYSFSLSDKRDRIIKAYSLSANETLEQASNRIRDNTDRFLMDCFRDYLKECRFMRTVDIIETSPSYGRFAVSETED